MSKKYVYEFNGTTYEAAEPFDETSRAMHREYRKNGGCFSRQVINGDTITDEIYYNGIWINKEHFYS